MKTINTRSHVSLNEALNVNVKIAEAIKNDPSLKRYLLETVLKDEFAINDDFASLYCDASVKMKDVLADGKTARRMARVEEVFDLVPILEFFIENGTLDNHYGFTARAVLDSLQPLVLDGMEITLGLHKVSSDGVFRWYNEYRYNVLMMSNVLRFAVDLGVLQRKHMVGDDRWYYFIPRAPKLF